MKKFFFSCLAIAAIASCAKTEPTFTEVDSEIRIAPVTAVATKANQLAAISGTAYPTAEAFDVYAYWANKGAGAKFTTGATPYLTAGSEGVEFVNKGAYWGGTTTYYWPKNGSLRFAAYSPSSLAMTHDLEQDTYRLENFTYPSTNATAADYTAAAYDILVAPTSESYTAETAAAKVSVVFEHALSWVTFKLQSTEVANGVFTVKDVIVNEVAKKGTLVAAMATAKTWQDLDSKSEVNVYADQTGYTVTSTATVKETVENGFLVIPQTPTTVTVKYTQNQLSHVDATTGETIIDSPKLENQEITVPLVLDNENDTWEPGKHYTYTILFDLDEILINPSVEDWEETTEVIVNSSPVKVTNSAELVAAVAEGKDVVLEQDITLDKPVIVEPVTTKAGEAAAFEVTIDLNGKDINAPLFAESNGAVNEGTTDSYALWVKEGAKLTINGNGNVTTQACTYSIAVWAQGGEVVINGGTYANAGEGSDLIYASAGGKVTIYGGEFKACEKQDGTEGTNEKYSALNIKDADKATSNITVYGGKFYGFDPANNKSENPAVSFVAEGYGSYELEAGVWTVVSKTAPVEVANEAALVSVAAQGGIATLVENVVLDASIDVYTEMTVNLNGKTITVPANATGYKDVFYVAKTGKLSINGKGNLIAEDGYSINAAGTAEVVLNDGYYFSPVSSVFATGSAVVTINGGTFEVDGTNNQPEDYGQVYTLNLKDDKPAKIYVKGGSYYNFNPADNTAEGEGTNFVVDGYKVLVDGDWYNVVAE